MILFDGDSTMVARSSLPRGAAPHPSPLMIGERLMLLLCQ
jgi:hypothetical protein